MLKKLSFTPDLHAPYHDRKAWKLHLKILREFQPDYHYVLGDFMDCYSVTQHDKTYLRKSDWQGEIDGAEEALLELQAAVPQADLTYIMGNHEDRWPRYLAKIAPQDNRRENTIADILKLKQRGWTVVEYKDFCKVGKLHITHDTGRAGKNSIIQTLDDVQDNIVIGHTHRMGMAYGGDAIGRTHVSACFGWLGDKAEIDYMHRVRANRDWQLGMGIGYLRPNGAVHVFAVPFVDYEAVVEGKLFKV